MPITSSAKKAIKVASRRKAENDLVRAKVKTVIKGIRSGSKEKGRVELPTAYREIDIAVKKHVIHKNKAARLKSRLSKASEAPAQKTTKKK